MVNDNMYQVVFEYTPEAGGYEGNRFIVSYKSEEQFEKMNPSEDLAKSKTKVIAKGVSDEEAYKIVSNVPLWRNVAASYQEAIVEGEFQPFIYEMRLQNPQFAREVSSIEMLRAQLDFFDRKHRGLVKILSNSE